MSWQSQIRKEKLDRERELIRRFKIDGESASFRNHGRTYFVYRIGSEYLIMAYIKRVKNPSPDILWRAKDALDRAAVLKVLGS